MSTHEYSSSDVGRAAMKLALTSSRAEETTLRKEYAEAGFKTAAVDFGGVFLTILPKLIEAIISLSRFTARSVCCTLTKWWRVSRIAPSMTISENKRDMPRHVSFCCHRF